MLARAKSMEGKVLLLDESHTAKNLGAKMGERVAAMARGAALSVYTSATPFENAAQAAYMGNTGLFDNFQQIDQPQLAMMGDEKIEASFGLHQFPAWAWTFDADVTEVWTQESGARDVVGYNFGWPFEPGVLAPVQMMANDYLVNTGLFQRRTTTIDMDKVSLQYHDVPFPQDYMRLFQTVLLALDRAEQLVDKEEKEGTF